MSAVPIGEQAGSAAAAARLLRIDGLTVHFRIRRGLRKKSDDIVHAVDDVSLDVAAGQTLALVGESGCGKSTVARAVLQLIRPTAGSISFMGADLSGLRARDRRRALREAQVVFQDPYSSLNPRMTVHDLVAEPLRANSRLSPRQLEDRVLELLEMVGLGTQHLWRRAHEFSGGQCQRIAIARALALEPRLVVLDEPTSALDVSVQARILVLLHELQTRLGLAYLFIAHDLAVVRAVSDVIAVMYLGQIVETGAAEDVLDRPCHPYTHALLSSVPSPDPERRTGMRVLEGDVPSAIAPPKGCRFHPRCPYCAAICQREEPQLRQLEGRDVACHLADDLDLGLEQLYLVLSEDDRD
jgi:oligopeptide/dipeptide ABC transporter ATP-binding protein